MTVRWLTAFLDLPEAAFGSATRFWSQVSASTLSPARGDRGEFATLLPADGDPYLRVQKVAGGPGGCHLDVHVDDMDATAQLAVELGAGVQRRLDDVIVMASPGGMSFCVVGHLGERRRPAPVARSNGMRSRVDQLCLDISPAHYERDCEFWSALTGWEHRPGLLPQFSFLVRPDGIPLRVLLQRLGASVGNDDARAHLDLACDDADAEAIVHEELGAQVRDRHELWVTMTDPSGLPYCLTRRDPDTGTLSPIA